MIVFWKGFVLYLYFGSHSERRVFILSQKELLSSDEICITVYT